MRRKKEKDELGLITEAREPFSLSNFFRVQAAGKFRHMKRILKEKGVLFFLFSPFQARSRLVVQLFLLAAGILFGIIPRATSMVSAVQDMAYQSEVHGLTQKRVGDLTITPAASSYSSGATFWPSCSPARTFQAACPATMYGWPEATGRRTGTM